MRGGFILLLALTWLLSSCEKEESAIVLPPAGTAQSASVTMGPNYEKQVFFDFESGQAVYTSDPTSWDIAFEAAEGGYHLFLNGGQGVFTYNTHQTDMASVKSQPPSNAWLYDDPSGLPDGTAAGDWRSASGQSKGEVYLFKLGNGSIQKLRMVSVNDGAYVLEWMPLSGSGVPTQVKLAKDTAYNFIYFSFSKGITQPDPVKSAWDVVFTHYCDLVYDGSLGVAVPYLVTGALLNPSRTLAAADSVHDFTAIDLTTAAAARMNNSRNVIGYDWKTVDLSGGSASYTVNRRKCYILNTRKEQLYKLHFLGFYSSTGDKGTPLFEYERLR